jgi:zinc protease
MAHLFEHMLFKRTKRFASIKDELTRLGGMANGTTWLDRTNYYESFAADDTKLARAIDLEAERLRGAIISRDELKTEMTVVRNEFEMGENDPTGVAMKRLLGAAYLWHSYGNETIGPKSDIEKVPNEKLLNWYETYYQPDNAMLVIAGRFDEAKAFKAIASTFGKLAKPKRVLPQTYTDEPTQDGENSITVRRVGGSPLVMVGYHIPSGTDPDAAAIELLTEVMGASPAGRVYQSLVEPKKAAEVQCFAFQPRDPGIFMCHASLGAKDQPAAAREALVAAIEQMKPPTKDELERARATFMKNPGAPAQFA